MHAEWRTARGIQQRLSHCKVSYVRWPNAGYSRRCCYVALLLIGAAATGVASRRGGSGPLLPSHPHRSRRALQESAPAAAAAAAPAPAAADTGQDGHQEVVLAVFGDSLSDTGNTFRAAGVPQADLYYQGRYSNGPIWVDYLAAEVANTTQLTVWNYAYGGAVACPDTTAGGGGGLSGRYPFIRDLPAQTELFLNQTAAEQRRWQQGQQAEAGGGGGGGARRRLLVPINWIGNDDVRLFMRAAIIAGSPPDSRALTSLALAITSCRLAWAQQLLAAGEAVWGQQRGPQRVLVLLPLMQLDLLPETPEPLRLQLRQIVAVLNAVLNGSVAALQQDLDAAAGAGAGGGAGGGGGGGARLLVLPEEMESLIQSMRPPFNSSGPCFNHPLDGLQPVAVADVRPCADPNNHAFYDQLHPSTRVHEALALRQVLPALRRAGLPL